MKIYKVRWLVPVPNQKEYVTIEREQAFKHKRTATAFKNQLVMAYEFIGIDSASTYVMLVTESIL